MTSTISPFSLSPVFLLDFLTFFWLWPWQETSLHCYPTWSTNIHYILSKFFTVSGEFSVCPDAHASNSPAGIGLPSLVDIFKVIMLNNGRHYHCCVISVSDESHSHKFSLMVVTFASSQPKCQSLSFLF